MTRLHRPATQRGHQNLTNAVGKEHTVYRDLIARLTLLEHDELCDTCTWPTTCAHDRTCWHQETAAASSWHRTQLDLPLSDKAGRNTRQP